MLSVCRGPRPVSLGRVDPWPVSCSLSPRPRLPPPGGSREGPAWWSLLGPARRHPPSAGLLCSHLPQPGIPGAQSRPGPRGGSAEVMGSGSFWSRSLYLLPQRWGGHALKFSFILVLGVAAWSGWWDGPWCFGHPSPRHRDRHCISSCLHFSFSFLFRNNFKSIKCCKSRKNPPPKRSSPRVPSC